MLNLSDVIKKLPDRHQAALCWFITYRGQERSWPSPLLDGTLLTIRPKGIYKPEWTNYALSVRQSLKGPYQDRDPDIRPDGTWSYQYFQENSDPAKRDSEYTNRGMVKCMQDMVPIGVLRQVTGKPSPTYQILGLAVVTKWEAGYFHLEGFSEEGQDYELVVQAEIDTRLRVEFKKSEEAALNKNSFDSEGSMDGRERVIRSIVRRRGQPEFRRALINAYGARCAISGCDAEAALEACHIMPYGGPETNSVSNGILLRADLHTLFDLGLLAVDTASMTVIISPSLEKTTYGEFAGRTISVPEVIAAKPSVEALDTHRRGTGFSCERKPI